MGIVQRESIRSTLISYSGAALGFVNIFLMTRHLSQAQVGLVNVLILIAISYAELATLGMTQVALRFFPVFRRSDAQYGAMLSGMLLFATLGFVALGAPFYLFLPKILQHYESRSPLITQYFGYLLPLAYSWLILIILDAYLRSLLKTVSSTVVRELFKRIGLTLPLLLYIAGWITVDTFFQAYFIWHICLTVMLLVYVWMIGELKLPMRLSKVWRRLRRPLSTYGLFAFSSYAAALLVGYVDSIMLSGLRNEAEAGVYTTVFYVATLIIIPWRALSKITSPLVAEHWKRHALDKLQILYRQTSLINLLVGSLCFLGIWINRDALFWALGEGYDVGATVLLLIGLGRVVDMWMGLNVYIFVLSKKYVIDFYTNIAMVVLGVAANYFFITRLGITGAAISTLLTIVVFNLLRVWMVWHFFRLHPFSPAMLKAFVVIGITWLVCEALPGLGHPLADALLRSFCCLVCFAALTLGWRVSPDINAYIAKFYPKKP